MIVVTGKGIHSQNEKDPYVSKDLSILKYSVPEFITNNQNLMKIINDIQDANIEDGGSGAFYVYLKKDKKDWNEFLNKKEKLIDKDTVLIKNKVSKTKIIDLHGYTLEEANKKVESIIEKSFKENISKIKIITGKGLHSQNEKNPYVSKDLSILKYSVPEFILNNTSLMKKIIEIKDAEVEDGGSGVFYVILKKIIK